jgi:hypothetical protein
MPSHCLLNKRCYLLYCIVVNSFVQRFCQRFFLDTLQGCEYAALVDQIFKPISSGKLSVGQLQVEMHLGAAGKHPVATIQKLLKHADAAGFRTFHKERNQWGCAGYKASCMHACSH